MVFMGMGHGGARRDEGDLWVHKLFINNLAMMAIQKNV